jgi:hypothetical protein
VSGIAICLAVAYGIGVHADEEENVEPNAAAGAIIHNVGSVE